MLISVFFMFWRYDRSPLSLLSQEGCVGLSALQVQEGDRAVIGRIWRKPLDNQRGQAAGSHSCENNPFLVYPTSWFLRWFGFGSSYLVLRLASMLYGCLSVAMLYVLISRMFNPGAGLLAAFMLAVSPWALGYSRVTGDYSASVFFTLACFFVFFFLKPGRHLGCLALGFVVSLATYFYGMARMVAPVIALVMVVDMALVKGYFRSRYQDFLFIAIGLYLGLSVQGGGFGTYLRQNIAWDWTVFADRPAASARLLSNLEQTGRRLFIEWGWNEEDGMVVERSAALDPVTRWCFFIGVVWGLIRIARSPYRFLFIWLAFAMLPPIITKCEFRRMCLAPVAIFAFAGVGIEHTVRLLTVRLGACRTAVVAVLLVPLLSIIGYLNYDHYFGQYERLPTDHLFKVRGEQRAKLIELMRKEKVYTDIIPVETGYEEGVRFDEFRFNRPGAVVILYPEGAATAAFARDTGPCALFLSGGRLEEK
ncbi:MAG: glycosyltransferase family 39 protein [Candidatus Aureabacteria bacterium]|nr:glycosyltransferase family 39 protein [Candidatus Auribacterota bacterium]